MNEDYDFDYQPPVQTETVQAQKAHTVPPLQSQPAQQAVTNTQPEQSVAVAVSPEVSDLRKGKLSVIPIGSSYWRPEESESKEKFGLVRWLEYQSYEKEDDRTGEITNEKLLTLFFAEQHEDLTWSVISNCSKKLVGDIEAAIKNGVIILNKTGVYIRYLGKVKNANNGFKHDNFEIRIIE